MFTGREYILSKRYGKLKAGDLKNALIEFNKAIDFEPNNPLTYLAIGKTESKLEMFNSAVESYSKAIEINSRPGRCIS